MIRLVLTGFAALLGLAFGSFLNVCLTRWPAEESVVKPRSHCRNCGRTLAWWENVPVLSWLVLRGRCRTCKTWIGWRYPLVELTVGGLWAAAAWTTFSMDSASLGRLSSWVLVASQMIFAWLAVALAVLDAEHLWLPNWLTLPGTFIGFFLYVADLLLEVRLDAISGLPLTAGIEDVPFGIYGVILKRLAAILAAAGIVLVIRWTYWLIRRQEGMGLGDAKLMAMLAAWLGLPGAVLSFAMAVVMGAAFAFVVLAQPRARRGAKNWVTTPLPFGTFLCVAAVVSALWGDQIIHAYLRMSGLN